MTEIDRQRERAAKNQSHFRDVNERIEELSHRNGFAANGSAFIEFVCECALDGCIEYVSLTREEYEDIRREPNRFFVLPGHALEGVEDVVDSDARYIVVAKLGVGAKVAGNLDPRQG